MKNSLNFPLVFLSKISFIVDIVESDKSFTIRIRAAYNSLYSLCMEKRRETCVRSREFSRKGIKHEHVLSLE